MNIHKILRRQTGILYELDLGCASTGFSLTHFQPLVSFCSHEKQRTMFSVGIYRRNQHYYRGMLSANNIFQIFEESPISLHLPD